MRAHGYSLIEMVLIVSIVSILLAIATLRFGEYSKRHATEAQARTIYVALLNSQATAVYQRRGTRVKLNSNSFETYSSLADGAAPTGVQGLAYPITWNNRDKGSNVDFDNKGIAQVLRSVCVDAGDGTGAVDSVVIGSTRVSIGKRDSGDACDESNIKKR